MTYLCNIVLLYDYIIYLHNNGYAKIYIYSKALP